MTPRPARVLVVDDEPDMAESVRVFLEREGYQVVVATEGSRALDLAAADRPDIAVTDLRMPGLDGLQFMDGLRARQIDVPVIVLTGYASVDSAVEAMKRGAADYLAKPFAPEELRVRVEKALAVSQLTEENRLLRGRMAAAAEAEGATLVGQSGALRGVLELVRKVAGTDARVLVVGESGTGKELVARTIHRMSARAEALFFAINCGALAEGILESEIFGHERGAFTGAVGTKKGFFEVADGGTLFLDEISETSAAFQTRLLRVLQEGEFLRVGGTRPLKTDIRLIASTNRDPRQSIAEGRLREDLFYRLSVVQIVLPPLRHRVEDIPALAQHFAETCSRRVKKRVAGIEPDAMQALMRYSWPGNIRELENVIERAIIMVEPGAWIDLAALPAEFRTSEAASSSPLKAVREAEREMLLRALRECDWNRTEAAKRLGIGRRTLYDKLTRHGISLKPNP